MFIINLFLSELGKVLKIQVLEVLFSTSSIQVLFLVL